MWHDFICFTFSEFRACFFVFVSHVFWQIHEIITGAVSFSDKNNVRFQLVLCLSGENRIFIWCFFFFFAKTELHLSVCVCVCLCVCTCENMLVNLPLPLVLTSVLRYTCVCCLCVSFFLSVFLFSSLLLCFVSFQLGLFVSGKFWEMLMMLRLLFSHTNICQPWKCTLQDWIIWYIHKYSMCRIVLSV